MKEGRLQKKKKQQQLKKEEKNIDFICLLSVPLCSYIFDVVFFYYFCFVIIFFW